MTELKEIETQVVEWIDRRTDAIAEEAVAHCWRASPELAERYGDSGRRKCLQDVAYHLSFLSNAVAMSSPKLFADYLLWADALLIGLGIPAGVVAQSVDALAVALENELPPELRGVIGPYLAVGRSAPASASAGPACVLDGGEAHAELTRQYLDRLLAGNRQAASRLILDAVEAGADVRDIYLYVFQPAQREVGRLWQTSQISVAQEHLFTAATQLIMSQLYSHVFSSQKNGRTLVAACVGGDLHEIGCRMVADFFEIEGWNTFYFGASTPTPSILEAIQEHHAEALVISATMTFHVRAVADLISAVRAADPDRKITTMVGGYPFNVDPDLWRQVGADLYARDAREAVATIRKRAA